MNKTTSERVWIGIAEIETGTKQTDIKRVLRGQEIVELALDTIPPSVLDNGKLMELNRAVHDIVDAAAPSVSGTQNFKKFHQALKRHQEILSELAGGNWRRHGP